MKTNLTLLCCQIHLKLHHIIFQTCLILVRIMESPWGGFEQKRSHGLWGWEPGHHIWHIQSELAILWIAVLHFWCMMWIRENSNYWLSPYLQVSGAANLKWNWDARKGGSGQFLPHKSNVVTSRPSWSIAPAEILHHDRAGCLSPLCLIGGRMHLQGRGREGAEKQSRYKGNFSWWMIHLALTNFLGNIFLGWFILRSWKCHQLIKVSL